MKINSMHHFISDINSHKPFHPKTLHLFKKIKYFNINIDLFYFTIKIPFIQYKKAPISCKTNSESTE